MARPPHPCASPDCTRLVGHGQGTRCPLHKQRNGSTAAWRRKRELILARDGLRCIECGATQDDCRSNGTSLQVHHRNGNPTDDRPTNLVTLCPACHAPHQPR